jgi:hypothetical protein
VLAAFPCSRSLKRVPIVAVFDAKVQIMSVQVHIAHSN